MQYSAEMPNVNQKHGKTSIKIKNQMSDKWNLYIDKMSVGLVSIHLIILFLSL